MQYRRTNNNQKKSYNPINRQNVKGRNNYYNYTSVAHDYEPDYKKNKGINKRIKKIKKEKYVKAEQGLSFVSLKFLVSFVIIATFIVAIIFVEALTIQKRFDIDTLNATLREINENNKNLETELAKNLDLDYVEYIATTELDMQKPASHQIVHISIPKESYSEKGNIQERKTIFSRLKDLFKN